MRGKLLGIVLATATLCACGSRRSDGGVDNAALASFADDNTASATTDPGSSESTDQTNDPDLDHTEAISLLARENVQCVDQIVTSDPRRKSRQEIIDEATRGCLSIAVREARLTPGADPEKSERDFVAAQLADLTDIERSTNSRP